MSTYKKMLVAIDLTEEAPQVLNKAKAMCDAQGAELLLVLLLHHRTRCQRRRRRRRRWQR